MGTEARPDLGKEIEKIKKEIEKAQAEGNQEKSKTLIQERYELITRRPWTNK